MFESYHLATFYPTRLVSLPPAIASTYILGDLNRVDFSVCVYQGFLIKILSNRKTHEKERRLIEVIAVMCTYYVLLTLATSS